MADLAYLSAYGDLYTFRLDSSYKIGEDGAYLVIIFLLLLYITF